MQWKHDKQFLKWVMPHFFKGQYLHKQAQMNLMRKAVLKLQFILPVTSMIFNSPMSCYTNKNFTLGLLFTIKLSILFVSLFLQMVHNAGENQIWWQREICQSCWDRNGVWRLQHISSQRWDTTPTPHVMFKKKNRALYYLFVLFNSKCTVKKC